MKKQIVIEDFVDEPELPAVVSISFLNFKVNYNYREEICEQGGSGPKDNSSNFIQI